MTCLDIATAAGLRPGPVRGKEHSFHCPHRGHKNGDEHASLLINTKKNLWMCGPCAAKGTAWQLAAFLAGVEPSDKAALLGWLDKHGLTSVNGKRLTETNGAGRRIVATYPYHDESGALLYEVVRYEPKHFRQRKADGTWNLDGVRRVLYRLAELMKAETVYIVEGEKDVDNLRGIGLTATCNPGGAGKWRTDYMEAFNTQQHVVILPDNDDPGRKHAQQVAAFLAGKVASLKVIEFENLPPKGDVSDWLEAGGTREQLEALAAATTEWASKDNIGMQFTRLGDLLNEPDEVVRWLVEDHLPAAGDSILVAKPKVGKSTLARCLALAVARGKDFLGCQTSQGTVFYLALEEKRSEVKRHFQAMGARAEDPIFVFCASAPADGLAQLKAAAQTQNPGLIIVDPLFRFTRVTDGNDYVQVTAALEPLHNLARETGAHVLAVHHSGKGQREGGDAVLGSTALFASVDTLMLMKRNEKYRTVSTIQRYGTDLEEITLEYDSDTRTLSAGVARAEADQAEAIKAIHKFLATQPEPVEEATIHESVEGRKSVKVAALRQAVNKTITRTGKGKKNDPYRYSVSCSLVPDICGEQTKQESENELSPSVQSTDACSRDFASVERFGKVWEPAFSGEEERL
jgi:5S rRNA maturation endonuclease (ribonuclease M5)